MRIRRACNACFRQVLSEESLPGGRRRVSLRLENRDNPSTVVFVPRDALVGWSLSDPVPTPWWGMKSVLASFVGPPGSTWDFTLELSGEGKVPVPFKSIHPTESADLTQARSQLPPWTTVTTYVAQVQTLSL